jgi:hypothetical protein
MPLHSALTGSELHENKGAAAASDNTVASVTSGATVWRKVNTDMLDTSVIFDTNKQVLQAVIDDVSTAETVYVYFPFDCTVTNVDTVLQAAITTADSIITLKNNGGTTMDTITVAYTGSAAGDIDTAIALANNTFIAGERMSIATDGGSTGTAKLFISVYVTVTG